MGQTDEKLVVSEKQPQSGNNEDFLKLAEVATDNQEEQADLAEGQPQLGNNDGFLMLAKLATEMGTIKSIG